MHLSIGTPQTVKILSLPDQTPHQHIQKSRLNFNFPPIEIGPDHFNAFSNSSSLTHKNLPFHVQIPPRILTKSQTLPIGQVSIHLDNNSKIQKSGIIIQAILWALWPIVCEKDQSEQYQSDVRCWSGHERGTLYGAHWRCWDWS